MKTVLFVMLCFIGAQSKIHTQADKKQLTTTRSITGMWSCTSKETVVESSGEEIPSWTFDLKLEVINNQIRGDYIVIFPDLRTDGNLYSPGEDSFDIRGKWNGDKYIVKYESSRGANVIAYIKPITSRKIEWRIISVKGGCSFAPQRAILTRKR